MWRMWSRRLGRVVPSSRSWSPVATDPNTSGKVPRRIGADIWLRWRTGTNHPDRSAANHAITAKPARLPGARARTAVRRQSVTRSVALRPNGVRLSCAALLWFSQLQFYYDGRRQLQPLVRLRTEDRRLDPALYRT